ncbi:MAG: hypothetical protein Q7T74_04695 [Candidatus Saccharibacteria bacterium]|nr:hypothetical protein [Candidatus Saccharibacteria bacterium]
MRRMDRERRRVNESLLEDAVFEATDDAVLDNSEANYGVRVTLASGKVIDTEIFSTMFLSNIPDGFCVYPLNGLNQPVDFESNRSLYSDEQLIAVARSALLQQTPTLVGKR